jgi:hypothetical protein
VSRRRCPYGDPTCPCQDGDACHYEGPDAWPARMVSRRVPSVVSVDVSPSGAGRVRRFVRGDEEPTERR